MSAPKVFICHECGKRFGSHSAMNMHVRAMENNVTHRQQLLLPRRKSWLRRLIEKIFRRKRKSA